MSEPRVKISMLAPVRPESKWMSHLIMSFLTHTENLEDTELLLLPAKRNAWNKDLMEYIGKKEPAVKFIPEPADFEELGQRGHHIFMNELSKHATGDWIFHFCDDMEILVRGWDEVVRAFVRQYHLNPSMCYMLIPRFKDAGAVEHILSRGWIEVTGCSFDYPNGDSWLNTVIDSTIPEFNRSRLLHIPRADMFKDYTRDKEYFHLFDNSNAVDGAKAAAEWHSEKTKQSIQSAVERLHAAYRAGR